MSLRAYALDDVWGHYSSSSSTTLQQTSNAITNGNGNSDGDSGSGMYARNNTASDTRTTPNHESDLLQRLATLLQTNRQNRSGQKRSPSSADASPRTLRKASTTEDVDDDDDARHNDEDSDYSTQRVSIVRVKKKRTSAGSTTAALAAATTTPPSMTVKSGVTESNNRNNWILYIMIFLFILFAVYVVASMRSMQRQMHMWVPLSAAVGYVACPQCGTHVAFRK